MKRLALVAALAWVSASPAHARDLPLEVLEPYRTYAALMKAEPGERDGIMDAALKAWQAAEKHLGDSKTTGDLAANFAQAPCSPRCASVSDIDKAWKRAIELSSFHGDMAVDVELQRRIAFREMQIDRLRPEGIQNGYRPQAPMVPPDINWKPFEASLRDYGKTGSTYEAEYHALRAQHALVSLDFDMAESEARRSRDIFAKVSDGLPSAQRFFVQLYLAEAIKRQGRSVESGQVYAELLTDHEARVGEPTAVSRQAFAGLLDILEELEASGDASPQSQALRTYDIPENVAGDEDYLVRVPPVMPPRAKRSGWVKVVFDVDETGRPENIRIADSSGKVFEKPAVESMKDWRYRRVGMVTRKDVETQITFMLTDRTGDLLPFKKEP